MLELAHPFYSLRKVHLVRKKTFKAHFPHYH